MKKITVLLLALLMGLTLSACTGKKEEVIGNGKNKVMIKVVDNNGEEKNYNLATDAGTVYDVLNELSADKSANFTFDTMDIGGYKVVKTINGIETSLDQGTYWDFCVRGESVNRTVENVPVEDGVLYSFIYTAEKTDTKVGGWEGVDGYTQLLGEEEKQIFEKAIEGLVGVGYTPIQVIATQVVNGTNYAYLAQGTTVTANPKKSFYIVKINKNTKGDVELLSAIEIEPDYVLTTGEENQHLFGGWTATTTGKAGMFSDEAAQTSFEKAMESYTGMKFNPIVLVAKQVVNGTNYIGIVRGETVTQNPVTNIYVVQWYADLEGNAKIENASLLNLAYYLDAK
ncbi:MAG: DUF4430 domain-containing protein [Erysipelotrichaceae bacterium]|nr:DUF4430 domain-containing protein [Erysipelotrichaceae bacterium]